MFGAPGSLSCFLIPFSSLVLKPLLLLNTRAKLLTRCSCKACIGRDAPVNLRTIVYKMHWYLSHNLRSTGALPQSLCVVGQRYSGAIHVILVVVLFKKHLPIRHAWWRMVFYVAGHVGHMIKWTWKHRFSNSPLLAGLAG
jgi:hypothetical protein